MMAGKKKDTKQFISEAVLVHKDKYSYEKSNYINSRIPLEIVCKIHGSFFQSPDNHVNKAKGCGHCAGRAQLTTEEFIKRKL